MHVRSWIVGAALLGACSTAAAGGYLGASLGVMDADRGSFDEATNAGLLAGYELVVQGPFSASLEGELTTTVADGDLNDAGRKGTWDIDARALYGAFRIGERLYLRVRFGYAWTDVSARFDGESRDDSDSGLSWGGSAGWMLNENLGLQLDGTLVDGDTTYWNAGIVYRF